jgi:hypothetical protein
MLERMWGKKGTFIHCWLEYKLVHPVQKTVWRLQKKIDCYMIQQSFLGIYPKECKSGYNKVTCTPMFIAALFIIAKLWK